VSCQVEQHCNKTAAVLDNQRRKAELPWQPVTFSLFCVAGPPKPAPTTEKSNNSSSGVQLLLTSSPTADSQLSMAICDLIHSCALPFSIASDTKFHQVLLLAKNASVNYKLPSRNQVAGELLDLNYDNDMKQNFM